jgi:CDP-diacylglycerol---glycerol-3-phosphate 3-phosphatidyltransferase
VNLPNLLTCSRILFTVFFVVFLFSTGFLFKLLALLVFILASVTDYWDGKLARKSGTVSVFGKIMDPVADKVLTLSAFFSFAMMGLYSFWLPVVVAFRDVLVTGFRFSQPLDSPVLASRQSGKNKTFFQIVFIVLILLYLIWKEWPLAHAGREPWELFVIQAGMILVVALTLWSGLKAIFAKRT